MASKTTLYILPTTGNERSRLDIQHHMLTLIFGGLYYPPDLVDKVIAKVSATGGRPNILDVGTGSGAWAEGMARKFPNADVTAVDLAPPIQTESTPPNCRFRYEDLNDGFRHYNDHFDIIQLRMVNHGAKDFRETLRNAAEILKPGGALILGTGVPQVHDDEMRLIEPGVEGEDDFCALQSVYVPFRTAAKRQTSSAESWFHWKEWLTDDPMYELYGEKEFPVPIGGWKTDSPNEVEAGKMQAQNLKMILPAFVKFAAENGTQDEETMQRWLLVANKEIDDPALHRSGSFFCAWATRSKTEWKPLEKAHESSGSAAAAAAAAAAAGAGD